MLADPLANLSRWHGRDIVSPPADGLLQEGMTIPLGQGALQVYATPGHSPGSVCFFGVGLLFSGDTLFSGGIGRTDIPGGDPALLRASIRKLLSLPGGTEFFPGHGSPGVLETEKQANPFLSGC